MTLPSQLFTVRDITWLFGCLYVVCFTENKTATGSSPGLTVVPPTSYQIPRHCSRIASKLCSNIGYNFTQMPNHFKQQNQVEVEYELSQFTPMIQSNCSPMLRVFLCSLYFPPCTDDPQLITLPCRYVCQKARRDCKLWIERSGLKWPYKFECSSFPEPSKLACMAEDSTITQGKKAGLPLIVSLINSILNT